MTRRRVLLAVLALFLVGVGHISWTLAGLPPVKYYLRYGLAPYCEPTGEKVTYEGVEFVEIGPGVSWNGRRGGGDLLGRVCDLLGLPWGEKPRWRPRWLEWKGRFWIAAREVTNLEYERFRPDHDRRDGGDDDPVVRVSWRDAVDYCDWLSARTDRVVRLPSEGEWWCVVRAGWDRVSKSNGWGIQGLSGGIGEWGGESSSSVGTAEGDSAASSSCAQGLRRVRGLDPRDIGISVSSLTYGLLPAGNRSERIGFRPAFSSPDD